MGGRNWGSSLILARAARESLKAITEVHWQIPLCFSNLLGAWRLACVRGYRHHNQEAQQHLTVCVCVCVCVCGYIVSVDVPAATAPLGVCGYTVSVEVPATTAPLGVCVATLSVWIYPPQKHLSVCVRKP